MIARCSFVNVKNSLYFLLVSAFSLYFLVRSSLHLAVPVAGRRVLMSVIMTVFVGLRVAKTA
jgi:hypothetical protein